MQNHGKQKNDNNEFNSLFLMQLHNMCLMQLHASVVFSTKYIMNETITKHLQICVSNMIIFVLFFTSMFEYDNFCFILERDM